jgi:hypothetical protein
MKIKAGKYYRTRGGDVVGPMRLCKNQSWYSCFHTWNEDGGIFSSGAEHDLDLISEVYVRDTPPSDVPAPPSAMLKPQDWRRLKPIEPSPGVETLRDKFAGRAMQGMLAREDYHAHVVARDAYEYADAMVEARKK